MWIHILIFLFYLVLFLSSKGFFSKSVNNLFGRLSVFMQSLHKQRRLCLTIIFWGNLLGFVISFFSYLDSASIKDGYLVRNPKGETAYEEELMVSDGKYTQKIEVVVEPVSYTKEELEQFLEDAYLAMDTAILGRNESLQHVEYPLKLMTEIKNTPVTVEWTTDQPMILDWEGAIGEDVLETGQRVLLRGELKAGDYVRVYERWILVYPEKLPYPKALRREIENYLKQKTDTSQEVQHLPKEINGQALIWHKVYASDGWLITALSMLMGGLLLLKEVQDKIEAQKRRKDQLLSAYPLLLNQLILYMRAGISSRMAIQRMVHEYEDRKNKWQKKHPKKQYEQPAYEELSRMYYEMEQGITQKEAYERLAKRCDLMEYRTLSNLLIQNLQKGGSHLFDAMQKECRQAFEERKRRAIKKGEEAGTKLLLPMVLMLLVVLLMIMVPSFLEW